MQARRFIQCDVFTPTPTLGNALAVVVDGEGVTEESMRRFAAWTNLAETTFILPPQDPSADYQAANIHPDTGNAVCRSSDTGELRRLVALWRQGQGARDCAPGMWCRHRRDRH